MPQLSIYRLNASSPGHGAPRRAHVRYDLEDRKESGPMERIETETMTGRNTYDGDAAALEASPSSSDCRL